MHVVMLLLMSGRHETLAFFLHQALFAGGVPGEPASVPLVGGAGAKRPAKRIRTQKY